VAFRDIRRDGYRGTPNLGRETESFIRWQLLSHLVGLDDQADPELPDVKVTIAAYHEGMEIWEGFRVSDLSSST